MIKKKKELLIEITNKCPFNCLFCSSNSNTHKDLFFEKNLLFDIISDAKEIGIEIIQLSGGEPFLHPNIEEFIDFIIQKNLFLEIYTCGNIYKKNCYLPIPNEILKKYKNNPNLTLRFNFQTIDENTFNILTRNPFGLKNLINTIQKCVNYKIRSEIHIIPLKYNLEQLDKTIEFLLYNLKIQHIKILRFIPHGRGKRYYNSLKVDNEVITEYLSKIIRKYKSSYVEIGTAFSTLSNSCIDCQAAKTKFMISVDLKCLPCTAFKNQNSYYIQINNQNSLKSIIQSNLLENYLNKFIDNLNCHNCLNIDNCFEICPIQKKLCNNFTPLKEINSIIQTKVQNYNRLV